MKMTDGYKSQTCVREWINRLHGSNFESSLLTKCFVHFLENQAQLLGLRCQQQQFLHLLELVLQKSTVDWLLASYTHDLIFEIIRNFCLDLTLMTFCSSLHEIEESNRLQFIAEVLQKLFVQGLFSRMLLDKTLNVTSDACVLRDKIISMLASLPDVIANKFKTTSCPELFHHERFFKFLAVEITRSLDELVISVESEKSAGLHTEFIGLMIGQFCVVGKAKILLQVLMPYMVGRTKDGFVLRRILHAVFMSVADRCMEQLLLHIMQLAPSPYCLHPILGDLLAKKPRVQFLLLHKLLLSHFFTGDQLAVVVVNVLHYTTDVSPNLVVETMKKVLDVWSRRSAIKNTPYDQHRYITAVLLVACKYLPQHVTSATRDDLMRDFMAGMTSHLESPDVRIRKLAMLLGEKLTDVLAIPTKDDAKLRFEMTPDEEDEQMMNLCDVPASPDDDFYSRQLDLFRRRAKECGMLPGDNSSSDHHSPLTYSVPRKAFTDVARAHNIALDRPLDGAGEHDSLPHGGAEDETDSDDDDDDLRPYEMPNERPFSKIARPMYVRDVMDGLTDLDSREKCEIYLDCLHELIERDADATKEIAVELARILLNLDNKYALDDFDHIRRRALVGCTVSNPEQVAEYLTGEFYSEHYALQHRLDMLDVLVMSAGRLSAITPPSAPEKEDDKEVAASLPWRQEVDERIERKTRRFGKGHRAVETSCDRFGPVSGWFFYPLMAGYDRRIRTLDLLGTDSIVLGRLMYALGSMLLAAANSTTAPKMSAALLEFVAAVRDHAEPIVRRACVYCVTIAVGSAIGACDDESTIGSVVDARAWLADVAERSADERSAIGAVVALRDIDRLLRRRLAIT